MSNVFADLSRIDVSKHLETKQGLSYLKWAAAWALLKNYDPEASFKNLTESSGDSYYGLALPQLGGTFMVGVELTIKGQTITEYLPVLDHSNNAMGLVERTIKTRSGEKTVAEVTAFEINNAYKRCFVKCAAMHGLGIQVYINGEGTALDLEVGLSKASVKAKANEGKPQPKNKLARF